MRKYILIEPIYEKVLIEPAVPLSSNRSMRNPELTMSIYKGKLVLMFWMPVDVANWCS